MSDRSEKLDGIAKLEREATSLGEWEVTRANDVVIYDPNGFGAYRIIAHANDRDDAAFIAAARTDVPFLLALVREQAAKLARVEEIARDWVLDSDFNEVVDAARIREALGDKA